MLSRSPGCLRPAQAARPQAARVVQRARNAAPRARASASTSESQEAAQAQGAKTRPMPQTYSKPSAVATGTLMPSAEWFPAWMKYRSRESNHVFWTDKFNRNSLDILPVEKRWTVFSTVWFLVMQFRFYAVPPALRFFLAMGWRRLMFAAYAAHKAVVLWQCKLDAAMAARAVGAASWQGAGSGGINSSSESSRSESSGNESSSGSNNGLGEGRQGGDGGGGEGGGARAQGSPSSSSNPGSSSSSLSRSRSSGSGGGQPPGFSRTMALRRLHWQNSLLAELLYLVNLYKTGRVHWLPPVKQPAERPTFFWLF